MLSEKQIILELEAIQNIIAPEYASIDKTNLREILDSIRITAQYLKLDNESLRRELADVKKKRA